ncbi:hypothetical protein [Tenacibaculum xiamenense]|uniref:hypothetical protein n=1 Tax=Tenacibaculum xiamenense TaxID=1261553 RepID=UPI0038963019
MNIKKLISFVCLLGTFYIGTAQNSNKHKNNIEISFSNYHQKAIEIILTKNDKTISELFHSYKDLRNTNKFKELGIDLENCIYLENNAIKVNIDKIGYDLRGKSASNKTTMNISHNSDNEKITIDIQIKNI